MAFGRFFVRSFLASPSTMETYCTRRDEIRALFYLSSYPPSTQPPSCDSELTRGFGCFPPEVWHLFSSLHLFIARIVLGFFLFFHEQSAVHGLTEPPLLFSRRPSALPPVLPFLTQRIFCVFLNYSLGHSDGWYCTGHYPVSSYPFLFATYSLRFRTPLFDLREFHCLFINV